MKNTILFLFLSFFVLSCKTNQNLLIAENKFEVETTINAWHKAAAEAKLEEYFSLMAKDGVFIGTDPTENWQNEAFMAFSKPYFDKGKAWSFNSIERNIYFSDDKKIAWFDELLDTHMKICRGSGVLKSKNGKWKIAHYVLSITIPNDNIDEVVKLKTKFDDEIMNNLKEKRH
jgi:ketosteroid isomerase-like protein